MNLISDEQPEYIVVFGADHVYRMDPSQMVQAHIESGAGVTVAGIRVPRAEAKASNSPASAKAVDTCPGNRRWMQLVFDAWLLMPRGTVSMVDARNAMLAADLLRFGGANQDLLWNGFADRGLGRDAASASSSTTPVACGCSTPRGAACATPTSSTRPS